MFDLGFTEFLVIGIVALIVVGPKDLPVLFRRAGEFVGKMRGMAREFSQAMDDAADQSGMKGAASSFKAMRNPASAAVDAVKDATNFSLNDIDSDSETGKLTAERKAQSAKIQAKTARMQAERKAKEAADALAKAEELEAKVEEVQAPEKDQSA